MSDDDKYAGLPEDHWLHRSKISQLPENHWLFSNPEYRTPPMGLRVGQVVPGDSRYRAVLSRHVVNAARYALRDATRNGTSRDIDPDALVQQIVIGLFGYHTDQGLSAEPTHNPADIPKGIHSELLALVAGRCDIAPLYMEPTDEPPRPAVG